MSNTSIEFLHFIPQGQYEPDIQLDSSINNQSTNSEIYTLPPSQQNYTSNSKTFSQESQKLTNSNDEASYNNIPSDPKLKRKLQNRESQRASRKRKDVYMNELQTKLQTFEDSKAESMIKAQEDNAKLKKMVEQLRVTKTALENKLSSLFGPNSFKDFMKKKSTPPSTPPAIFASSSTLIQSPMPNSSFSTDQENDDPQMYFLPRKKPSEETGELVMPTDPTSLHPIYSTTPRPKELVESWERFSKHPRFDDIDLDFVCTEMKKKAQITDHNEKLNSIIELHYPA